MKKPRNARLAWTRYRLLQEKSSGLFFGFTREPDSERHRAWLFNEHEVLALVRARYGGDHGMDLVTIHSPPTSKEMRVWRARIAGMGQSVKKTRAVRKNGARSHSTRTKL